MSGMPDVQACGIHKGEKRCQACRMCRRAACIKGEKRCQACLMCRRAACIKGKRDFRHAGGMDHMSKNNRIAEIIPEEVQDYDVRYEKKVFSWERRVSCSECYILNFRKFPRRLFSFGDLCYNVVWFILSLLSDALKGAFLQV